MRSGIKVLEDRVGDGAIVERQHVYLVRMKIDMLAVWQQIPQQAQWIYRMRVHVEGTFSNLTRYGGGLGPLPAFVRRLDRVRRWVGAKIILYHLRLNQRQPHAA